MYILEPGLEASKHEGKIYMPLLRPSQRPHCYKVQSKGLKWTLPRAEEMIELFTLTTYHGSWYVVCLAKGTLFNSFLSVHVLVYKILWYDGIRFIDYGVLHLNWIH